MRMYKYNQYSNHFFLNILLLKFNFNINALGTGIYVMEYDLHANDTFYIGFRIAYFFHKSKEKKNFNI